MEKGPPGNNSDFEFTEEGNLKGYREAHSCRSEHISLFADYRDCRLASPVGTYKLMVITNAQVKIVREESTNYSATVVLESLSTEFGFHLPEGESVSHQNLPSVVYVHQPTTFNMPEGLAVDSDSRNRIIGLSVHRQESDSADQTHWMNPYSGAIYPISIDKKAEDDFSVKIAGFSRTGQNIFWDPNPSQQFHDEDPRIFDFTIDPGHKQTIRERNSLKSQIWKPEEMTLFLWL